MLKHYLKIAIRNLLKYRSQSFISIFGLAIGFTCFALGTLWIHYEMTYDSFHKDADRIYLVRQKSLISNGGLTDTPKPLAASLKQKLPEIEASCAIYLRDYKLVSNGVQIQTNWISADSSFMDLFGIKILSGNSHFLQVDNKEWAITEALAKKLFGNESPIGKELDIVDSEEKVKICAVVNGWTGHSNIPFDLIASPSSRNNWASLSHETFVKLYPNTNIDKFVEKLRETKIEEDSMPLTSLVVNPLTSLRYESPRTPTEVKFNHILLFSLAGGLVILCSLFNFLMLFVTRIYTRKKELALRQICGSSYKGLLALFSIEFLILFFTSLLIGMVLIELVYPFFKELAEIHSNKTLLLTEALCYAGFVVLCSYILVVVILGYLRYKTLSFSIKGATKGQGNSFFRKSCILFQLIISFWIIFCSFVIVKQLHFLRNTDIGMTRKNCASIASYPYQKELEQILSQIPGVTEIMPEQACLLPYNSRMSLYITDWTDKKENAPHVNLEVICGVKSLASFYELRLLKGEMVLDDDNSNDVMINEAAAKLFDWQDPIGKSINSFKIKGLIKDTYNASPTTPPNPTLYISPEKSKTQYYFSPQSILFKYKEGSWNSIKKKLEEINQEKKKEDVHITIHNAMEEYEKYLQSEKTLLKMLYFTTAVCIMISLFGVFSLVTLTCEQRKKEIAIRKVNEATIGSILKIFFYEYLLLIAVSAAIAFPIGYLAMRHWLESYVKQTEINSWIYPLLFISVGLVIAACISGKIWITAKRNPAEIIHSE